MTLSFFPFPYPYPFSYPGFPAGDSGAGGRSGTGTGTARPLWSMVACIGLVFGAVVAEDRVLVPLDAADTDRWLSRVLAALDDIDRGKYREAIDVLQAGVLEGEGRGLSGAGPAAAAGRTGHRSN